jgi:ubiquitin-activating enzyme E1
VCALMGGVLGQEVLKAVSGKFTPIKQWFYFDGSDSLPDEPLAEQLVAPIGCRYDGQIAVYGKDIQVYIYLSCMCECVCIFICLYI